MKAAVACTLVVVAMVAGPDADSQVALRLPPTLPLLPVVGRIGLEVARNHVTVIEDLDLPRGDWRFGDLDLYVAFGSPGAPRAFDARLFADLSPGGARSPDEVGEPVVVEPSSRRPGQAYALLGRPQMAGVVVHLRESAF